MAADEPSGPRPAPVVLRIKLRYDDVESMVQRFAPNVGKSGLFLPTKSLQPVGAEVKFELRIADDTPVLVGLGRVKAAKAPDPAAPRAAFGMAIELMRVTRESREVILRMLERRKQLSLPEVGIPMPADIDAARRAEVVDTQVKHSTTAAVPAPVQNLDSGPSEALLTAPRRQSGPIAIAKLNVVEALSPEPARRKRPAVHEVIESASGPIVSVVSGPGLDDDIDVGKVIARARALAGGDLDAELEALREVAAAPLEISIEAASAELARQLGGKAINKKDRSARWATPPVTVAVPAAEPAPVIAKQADPAPEPAPEPAREPMIAKQAEPAPELEPVAPALETQIDAPLPAPTFSGALPTFVDDEDSGPVHTAPQTPADIITDPATPLIDDDVDPAAFEAREHSAREVEPDQIADEIHQLGEDDYEEVEHTMIGAMPEAPGFEHQAAFVTEPGAAADLERSLDAHLAEAEAEAEADDLGISGAYALPEAPAQAPAQAPMLLQAEIVPDEPGTEAANEEPHDQADHEVEDLEEIDEFEILAEADADDADLLASHGEADVSGGQRIAEPEAEAEPQIEAPVEPEPRPSIADFVSRLDLSDEFEAAPDPGLDPDLDRDLDAEPAPPRGYAQGRHDASFSELDARLGELDAREMSAGHALAAFEDDGPTGNPDDLDADSQYTIAGVLPPADVTFDAPHTGYEGGRAYAPADESYPGFPARSFDESDVEESQVPARRGRRPASPQPQAQPQPQPGDDGYDLETALEALDVDLDDLSVPHERLEPRPSQRAPSQRISQRAPSQAKGKLPERATTDGGVLIQFEDDE
ncbi:MAG: hypothetical protein IPQ07_35980 [Myxococcales bacterium]|nr:hypothetical protein [Myxococcales bacterium]